MEQQFLQAFEGSRHCPAAGNALGAERMNERSGPLAVTGR